jgi:Mrp family chromosome partitioning ATPase
VIIDTAPVGLVSDPVLLSRFADICLYVVRQNYTAKKHLEMVDDLYRNKRIPRIGIVVNDVKANGEYGYYYGYSTYGYGNEYFEEGTVKMNFVKKLKGYFGRK